MKSDPVQDFILQSERNLKIAETVADAWPRVRNGLVNDFLERLGKKLLKRLRGWECEPWEQFFVHPYPNISVWKPSWHDQYWIVLQCRDKGQRMEMGVMRNQEIPKVKKRPYGGELLDALRELYPSARDSTSYWFDASATMRSPAVDWSTSEVMWKLHADSQFLDDVAEQLCQIAKISAPIIDRLTKSR